MHEVIMPKLGLTMESGKIEKWHKKEGDKVETGDILFEVMTDKVSLEVESYSSGILRKIIKAEGDEVPVTEVVAFIGTADEKIPDAPTKAPIGDTEVGTPAGSETASAATGGKPSAGAAPSAEDREAARAVEGSGTGDSRIKISPLARKIAGENNIDINTVEGSGPRGRIIKEDIERAIAEAKKGDGDLGRIKISPLARKTAKDLGIDWKTFEIAGSGPGGRIIKEDIVAYSKTRGKAAPSGAAVPGSMRVKSTTILAGMRKVIAQRMSLSKSTIPHIVLNAKADATNFIQFREQLKEGVLKKYEVKITFTDLILKATALALRDNIEVNSSLQGDQYIIYEDVNVGMAISVEEGLIVPTLFSCDDLEIIDIARKRVDLIGKARSSKLALEEIQGGTFTVTNLGMFGIRNFSAIINPPQAAILAVGEIYEEPAVIQGGKIGIKSFMDLSVSCDHRIIDGAVGSRFLQNIVELIENPAMLVI
ncbi:MAG: 2-oxo acid dehydrogenase subunit E2 [Actinomycetota bacterium]|nr:MAG: 2-oxo acid dehydrogenase subunit E2 [Actinomycetota bacterium]